MERRTQTREALLAAAADLFASRGVDGASIDAIAEAADRTSGAVYDHFGGKDGLLLALLGDWVDDVAAAIGAELAAATTLEDRMAALWSNVARPVAGGGRWIALEHELWRYATRNDDARRHLARRYRGAWVGIDRAIAGDRTESGTDGRTGGGPVVIGVLLGLEMMRRIDPASMPDELAVAALCGVAAATTPTHEEH